MTILLGVSKANKSRTLLWQPFQFLDQTLDANPMNSCILVANKLQRSANNRSKCRPTTNVPALFVRKSYTLSFQCIIPIKFVIHFVDVCIRTV